MTVETNPSQCYVALFAGADCSSDGGVYLISADWYANHFGGNFATKGFLWQGALQLAPVESIAPEEGRRNRCWCKFDGTANWPEHTTQSYLRARVRVRCSHLGANASSEFDVWFTLALEDHLNAACADDC